MTTHKENAKTSRRQKRVCKKKTEGGIMMRCTQVQKTFFSFLSGNLDCKTQREFLEHLHHCPKCHDKWQQLQVSNQMLESLADEEDIPKAPVDFWQRLEHRLESPATELNILAKFGEILAFVRRALWIPKLRRVAVLSGLFLCLGFGLIGYRIFHSQIPNYLEHGHVREIYLLENLFVPQQFTDVNCLNYSEFDDVNIELSSFNPAVERYLLDKTEVDAIQDISAEGLPLIEEIFYISEPSDKRIL